MKQKLWKRLTSGLLSILLVITSIPLTAVTAFGVSVNASIEDYKYNKLWGVTNPRPMAYATSTQGPRQSILSSPVAAAGYEDADTDWMYFAFSIAMTQKVNLKVYKYDTGEPDLLLYNEQYNQVGGPADTAFPASKHHVADPEDFLGYLNAYQYKDHLDPSGTTVVKGTLEEIEADLKRLSEGGLTLTAAKDVEVYGLSGQALPWSTPAQYFLAKGQTPPWVRDSGPVPEDEDEEVLPEEEPGMDDPAPEETPKPDAEPDETDLSKADEMYPGGEDYDLELMPEDFFLPPFPYQGEEESKPRKAARAAEPGGEGEGFIHNYFLWDGTIVTEDGAVESPWRAAPT